MPGGSQEIKNPGEPSDDGRSVHPFEPIPLYLVDDPDPLWTDWCGRLSGPLTDPDVEVCGRLEADHAG
jgi:hypothetical protein